MKTLAIFAIILGVGFLYFVAKAERSIVINGNEVIPAGIVNLPKTLLDKASETIGKLSSGNQGIGDIVTGSKNLISKTVGKLIEIIKTPIEDKVNSFLCPQK